MLIEGITINVQKIKLYSQNPFIIRGDNETPSTRLIIGDVPISYSNTMLESNLLKLGVKLRSKTVMEKVRDRSGRLTDWTTGRRILWIELPATSLPHVTQIGPFRATLYYREQKKPACRRCLQEGHRAQDCTNPEVCSECKQPGHRKADGVCQNLNVNRDERKDKNNKDDESEKDKNSEQSSEEEDKEEGELESDNEECGIWSLANDESVANEKTIDEERVTPEKRNEEIEDRNDSTVVNPSKEKEKNESEEGSDNELPQSAGAKSNGGCTSLRENANLEKENERIKTTQHIERQIPKSKEHKASEGKTEERGRRKGKAGKKKMSTDKEESSNEVNTLAFFLSKARSLSQKRRRSSSPVQNGEATKQRAKVTEN